MRVNSNMEELCLKTMTDNFIISFLQRFDEHPFDVKIHGKTHHIGNGNPAFVVDLKEDIEGKELLTSTSLALGEAYMKGNLEVEGDLFEALDSFLGQMDRFSTDWMRLGVLIDPGRKGVRRKRAGDYLEL